MHAFSSGVDTGSLHHPTLHVVEDAGAPLELLFQHALLAVGHVTREPGCGVK